MHPGTITIGSRRGSLGLWSIQDSGERAVTLKLKQPLHSLKISGGHAVFVSGFVLSSSAFDIGSSSGLGDTGSRTPLS